MPELRYNTAFTSVFGPFLDKTDGVSEKTTLSAQRGQIYKNGMYYSDFDPSHWNHVSSGVYQVGGIASDTDTLGSLRIIFTDNSTYLPVWRDFEVVSQNYYDSKYGSNYVQANIMQVNGTNVTSTSDFQANLSTLNDISISDVKMQVSSALSDARLDELMVNALDAQPTTGSLFADLTEDDSGTQRFTTNALEQAPSGAADWTSGEKEQIRDALGIDGSKTTATGGQLQNQVALTSDLPIGFNGLRITNSAVDSNIHYVNDTSITSTSDFKNSMNVQDVWTYGTRQLTDPQNFNNMGQTSILPANVKQWQDSNVPSTNVAGVPITDPNYWLGDGIPATTQPGVPEVDVNYLNGVALQSAGGYIGIDWNKVNNQGSTVALTSTTIGVTNELGTQAKSDVNAEVDGVIKNLHLDHLIVVRGHAVTGTLQAGQFTTDLTIPYIEFYTEMTVLFVSGNLAGQMRRITGSDNISGTLFVMPDFSVAPDNNDEFVIIAAYQQVYVDELDSQVQNVIKAKVDDSLSDYNVVATSDLPIGFNGVRITNSAIDSNIQYVNDIEISSTSDFKNSINVQDIWTYPTRQLTASQSFNNTGQTSLLPVDLSSLNDISASEVKMQVSSALSDARLDELMVNALDSQPATGSLWGDLTEDDGGTQRFTVNALENAPTGIGSGQGDWTTSEKEQIRDALGVDGDKTTATGGQLQNQVALTSDLPVGFDSLRILNNTVDANIKRVNDDEVITSTSDFVAHPDDIKAAANAALISQDLDHLIKTAIPGDGELHNVVQDNSIIGNLAFISDNLDYDRTVHSLQAQRNNINNRTMPTSDYFNPLTDPVNVDRIAGITVTSTSDFKNQMNVQDVWTYDTRQLTSSQNFNNVGQTSILNVNITQVGGTNITSTSDFQTLTTDITNDIFAHSGITESGDLTFEQVLEHIHTFSHNATELSGNNLIYKKDDGTNHFQHTVSATGRTVTDL